MKSVLNQTKLNLQKKIKKIKQEKAGRKKDELELLKRLKLSELPLCEGLHPEKLQKILTNPGSLELQRAQARVLLNPLIQKKLNELKEKYSIEPVESFLKDNDKNIQQGLLKRLDKPKALNKKKNKLIKREESPESEKNLTSAPEQVEGVDKPDSDDNSKTVPAKKKSKINGIKMITNMENTKSKKQRRNKPEEVIQKSADPFFMDSAGQNYLASITAAISSESENEAQMNEEKLKQSQKKKTAKFTKTQEFKPAIKAKEDKKINSKTVAKKIVSSKYTEPKAVVQEEPDVHPSWKAKAQMRKIQIADFQGTKTIFNDDE